MKTPLFQLVCLIITSFSLSAAEEWHTFKDNLGRSFEGRVISINQDLEEATVLARKSGKNAKIAFSILSPPDITYLREWIPEEPEAKPKGKPKDEKEGKEEEEASGEISSRIYSRTKAEIKDSLKKIKKRDAPEGIERDQQETINELNTYRYLSGVPDEVEADKKMVAQATDAAQAFEEIGKLSHGIGRSTNLSNLAMGGTMLSSVRQYMNDGGSNNRAKRGHRRWCLNPPMGKTGFGSEKRYSAMISMDSSGGGRVRDSWGYPGKGFFPKEYMHGNGWSLYLNKKAPPSEDLKVEVYKLRRRPEKPFSSSEEIPGKALPVEFVSTYANAINFEPQPEPITGRGIYWVRIKGGGVREAYLVELY